ncbi:membrane protein [Acrocarpospora pleiomorpha]|uniref:Membrane protein n=1 Tax=Acrocarpospora pleiomorpha TaxID=90975 RepID=A0A5M3XVW3_9ACTN|nr:PH domain-containing protein [Acrocarpospora pleiomorpha]GES23473.1 membrane protein [Acrocarpospora pleiomorpha]
MTYRSTASWIFGWVWLAFAALNTADLIARGTMPTALVVGAVLGVITFLVFVMSLRPATITEEGGVRVRNPFRTAFLPWNTVDGVEVSNAITIRAGELTVRCWTPQPSARERAKSVRQGGSSRRSGRYPTSEPVRTKGEQAAAEAMAGRTHADWAAEQIRALAEKNKRKTTGEASVIWSPYAIGAATATVILVVAAAIALAL